MERGKGGRVEGKKVERWKVGKVDRWKVERWNGGRWKGVLCFSNISQNVCFQSNTCISSFYQF